MSSDTLLLPHPPCFLPTPQYWFHEITASNTNDCRYLAPLFFSLPTPQARVL